MAKVTIIINDDIHKKATKRSVELYNSKNKFTLYINELIRRDLLKSKTSENA